MGESPARGFSPIFRNQDDAALFGMAALEFTPMLDGESGIAAAVRLERRLIILESADEGQDRRLIGGQTCLSDTNDPAP
jgi:hypothetical protein